MAHFLALVMWISFWQDASTQTVDDRHEEGKKEGVEDAFAADAAAAAAAVVDVDADYVPPR